MRMNLLSANSSYSIWAFKKWELFGIRSLYSSVSSTSFPNSCTGGSRLVEENRFEKIFGVSVFSSLMENKLFSNLIGNVWRLIPFLLLLVLLCYMLNVDLWSA